MPAGFVVSVFSWAVAPLLLFPWLACRPGLSLRTMAKLQTLRPRIATQPGRLAVMQPGSWRTDKQTAAQRGYGYKWQKARAAFLAQPENVLCRMCEREGQTVIASVVDHIVPHRGDQSLFWKRSNWQPLCASCHSSEKQRQDATGDVIDIEARVVEGGGTPKVAGPSRL